MIRNTADRHSCSERLLDAIFGTVRVDERRHHSTQRSHCAGEKKPTPHARSRSPCGSGITLYGRLLWLCPRGVTNAKLAGERAKETV